MYVCMYIVLTYGHSINIASWGDAYQLFREQKSSSETCKNCKNFLRWENRKQHIRGCIYFSPIICMVLFPSPLHLYHLFCLEKCFTRMMWSSSSNVYLWKGPWHAQPSMSPSIGLCPLLLQPCCMGLHLFLKSDQGRPILVALLSLTWYLVTSRHSVSVCCMMPTYPVSALNRIKCEDS